MKLELELTPTEAAQLAIFLKRITYDTFLACSNGAAVEEMRIKGGNDDQAYSMQNAAVRVRDALADAGYEPR